jgi:hypothetical protein
MTRVTVTFDWQPVGVLRLEGGRPGFPPFADAPGLYRFTFEWPDRARGVYMGETDRLRRRAQHYRTPGAGQQTNVRMNKELVAALTAQIGVTFAIVTTASISIDGSPPVALDLTRKTGRLIVENAAMAAVIAEREEDPMRGPLLINRPGVGEAEWS